ncbi:hypothetical protein D3C77_538000 [compost metagenome]
MWCSIKALATSFNKLRWYMPGEMLTHICRSTNPRCCHWWSCSHAVFSTQLPSFSASWNSSATWITSLGGMKPSSG